jgi:hypothetical protein
MARLVSGLRPDVEAIDALACEVEQVLPRFDATTGVSRPDLALMAVDLHAWYTGLETGLARIARDIDDEMPAGPEWHKDLLSQMRTPLAGVRPAVIPQDVLPDLHALLAFRHFFRNAYAVHLDAAKLRDNAARLLRVHAPVTQGLRAFVGHVEQAMATLAAR